MALFKNFNSMESIDSIRSRTDSLATASKVKVAEIVDAQKEKVSFNTEKEMVLALSGYVGSERRAEVILDNRAAHDVGLETTRWSLYNLFTDYATHTELSVSMYDRIQNGAERILTSPVILPEAVA
ncbi:MAG TPA: hypothetical protein PLN36_01490 [Bacteroidales bacterium]|mgnify:CR=1 FL=1|nr:hypothetical protein [Bacteroidales bacterium]